jgi:hypothetical protein
MPFVTIGGYKVTQKVLHGYINLILLKKISLASGEGNPHLALVLLIPVILQY